jgi:recombination protein RecA
MAVTKTKTKIPDYLKKSAKDYGKSAKDYGQIIKTGTEVLKEKSNYEIISVGPAIDIALGGGIKEGSWVTLTGDPKSGKTTTAMQIACNVQKMGRNVIYIDAEGRFKDMNFQVDGLDPEKMLIMAPEDKPIPAEKFLEWAYLMMSHPDNYGAILIIDSISSLIPSKELDGDFSPSRAGLPKILSIFTKKIGQLLPRQRGLVIAITHYIANTSGFGKAKMADGGNKIQYQADTRMEIAGGGEKISAVKYWDDDDGKRIGQLVNWKIVCSSMGPPGGQVQSYIRYGHGIDKTQEILTLALDLGLIDKSGAWFTCSFLQMFKDVAKKIFPDIDVENEDELFKNGVAKFQGQNKLYTFLASNPKLVEVLEKMIKEGLA